MIFVFHQNNSGGSFIENDKYAQFVIVETETSEKANKFMEELGAFELPYCSCCGERFYRGSDYDFKDEAELLAFADEHWKGRTFIRYTVVDKNCKYCDTHIIDEDTVKCPSCGANV